MSLRTAAVYVALWAPLVLVYAVLIGGPNQLPITTAISSALISVGAAAVLGVPALWWARRLARRPLDTSESPLPWSPVAGHVLGAALFASLWTLHIVHGIRLSVGSWPAAIAEVRPWVAWQFFFGMVVYAVIAGVAWAMLTSERTRAREAQLRDAEAQRTRAELAALRAQVEPHFLYNALHTATALVRRDPAAAEAALEQLAALLRYVLDPARGAREDVPLDEELRFVELYLAIERARLGERLRVQIDIDDEARDVLVPSLSLQPLVENAIRHGLAPQAEGGTIIIAASLHPQHLVLTVRDDGVGSSAAHEQATTARAATAGTGIGLDALRKRLRARYEERALLDVVTAPGRGCRVTLRLPV